MVDDPIVFYMFVGRILGIMPYKYDTLIAWSLTTLSVVCH